jgi:predicted amidohydrolase YtcJ
LRRTDRGEHLGPDEALTAGQALDLYAGNAAFVTGVEDRLGSLEAGKLADFVVLDRDPLTVRPEAVRDAVVQMTVVGGDVVFERVPVT